MLSYRHAFHAGNHADVLKHFVLDQVLHYFTQKDKPYWYIDTHAGAGLYRLDEGYATQNAEYASGIARFSTQNEIPASLKHYLEIVEKLNENTKAKLYPGSPFIAEAHLRRDDRMRLFELHPADYKLLVNNFEQHGRQVKVEMQDGFAGIKALLPPASKRGVTLIDPPYEEKQDYQRVVETLKACLSRFATGTYLVWYPLLQRPEPMQMLAQLKQLQPDNWLNVALTVQTPSADGFGMFGSGMLAINPPWTLPKTLEETMPFLTHLLGQDDGADFVIESRIA
jgi:23S rRNA (adenine2030-N6)-methyltransferase